jgi:hypothetical protein
MAGRPDHLRRALRLVCLGSRSPPSPPSNRQPACSRQRRLEIPGPRNPLHAMTASSGGGNARFLSNILPTLDYVTVSRCVLRRVAETYSPRARLRRTPWCRERSGAQASPGHADAFREVNTEIVAATDLATASQRPAGKYRRAGFILIPDIRSNRSGSRSSPRHHPCRVLSNHGQL